MLRILVTISRMTDLIDKYSAKTFSSRWSISSIFVVCEKFEFTTTPMYAREMLRESDPEIFMETNCSKLWTILKYGST